MSSNAAHARTERIPAVDRFGRQRPSSRLVIGRGVVLVVVLLLAWFYVLPRVLSLAQTPFRLDQAIVSANQYNPQLQEVVSHERVTLAAFDALDRVERSLADVRATDAKVADELKVLIGQITGDLQSTLNQAGTNVDGLVSSLNGLDGRLRSLDPTVNTSFDAVGRDSASLNAILADAKSTAAKVHSAAVRADTAAGNVSGK